MLKLIIFFVLYELTNVHCYYESLPEIEMVPTGVTPKICVSASRDLPPCGIGKFKEHQRKYEKQIQKILESYVDMIIDYKDGKNSSFENYGEGKIYLKSFDSLTSELEEEERQKLLNKANSSNIEDELIFDTLENYENQNEEDTIEDLNFRTVDIDAPSIIQITRAVRSLEMTVLVADQCIPLGVLFCDFPKPTDDDHNIEVRKRKRSVQSFSDVIRRFSSYKGNEIDNSDVKNEEKKPKVVDFLSAFKKRK